MEETKRGRGRPPGREFPERLPHYDTAEGMALLHELAKARGESASAVIRYLVRREAARLKIKPP
jgi:hypothetical protein